MSYFKAIFAMHMTYLYWIWEREEKEKKGVVESKEKLRKWMVGVKRKEENNEKLSPPSFQSYYECRYGPRPILLK